MHPYVVLGLDFGPVVIERLFRAIPSARREVPTGEGRFSPREVLAHLADWEPILRSRISTAVESPGSRVPVYDEDRMAIDHRYNESDPEEQIRLFAVERAKTTGLIKGLQPGQRSSTVIHPERGEISVDDIIGMLIGHDMYHVEQLSAAISA